MPRSRQKGELLPLLADDKDFKALRAGSGSDDTTALEELDEGVGEEYDYEDHDVYQFSHYWDSMSQYVDALVFYTNLSLSDQVVDVSDKVVELESRLSARDEEIAFLREAVEKLTEKTREPTVGDVRLVNRVERENETTGKLLFFAGEYMKWGYVCDDMFSTEAATVACRQLGYSSGHVDITHDESFLFDPQNQKYPIVLDDVLCESDSVDLLSCRHLPIGVHNCGPTEAIHVKCFH